MWIIVYVKNANNSVLESRISPAASRAFVWLFFAVRDTMKSWALLLLRDRFFCWQRNGLLSQISVFFDDRGVSLPLQVVSLSDWWCNELHRYTVSCIRTFFPESVFVWWNVFFELLTQNFVKNSKNSIYDAWNNLFR